MKIKPYEYFDFLIFFCVVSLITIGILFIYSSGINSSGINISNEYSKQIIWAAISVVIMVIFAIIDFRKFDRYISWFFWGLALVLLYTRFFGRYVNGARSWLGIGEAGVQPSEFFKIAYIFFFAHYLEKSQQEKPLKRYVTSIAILLVPLVLILAQPDLGTASVFIPIFLFMCFIAGIPTAYILVFLLLGLSTILFTVLPIWGTEIYKKPLPVLQILTNSNLKLLITVVISIICIICIVAKAYTGSKYFLWLSIILCTILLALLASSFGTKFLKPYQIKRLVVFVDPESDRLDSGWNIIQSKIAIGSGNIFGQGLLKGTQSHYRFLPQQSTDFIFSIFSEESGFIGGCIVFFLYLVIMLRALFIIKETPSTFGTYIATGILGMLFFHFVVNVGMVMGIMPITGIPLLFMSYGGSSLWTAMASIGILMSINARRMDFS